jgi:hypothetical protein
MKYIYIGILVILLLIVIITTLYFVLMKSKKSKKIKAVPSQVHIHRTMVKAHQDQVISYQAQAKAHQAQVLIHQAQVDAADADAAADQKVADAAFAEANATPAQKIVYAANAKKKAEADAEAKIKYDNQLVTTLVSQAQAQYKATAAALVITKAAAATKAQADNSAAVILNTVNQPILNIISVDSKNRWGSVYGTSGNNIFIRLLNGAIWMVDTTMSFTLNSIVTDDYMYHLYTPGMGNNGWQSNQYITSNNCSITAPILPNGPLNRCIVKDIAAYGIKDVQINPNRKAGNNILRYFYGNQVTVSSDSSGLLTIPTWGPTIGANPNLTVIQIR